jgi:hypothetical protein
MSKGCKARVWDNGDCTSCDEPVYRNNKCRYHFDADVILALREVEKKIQVLKDLITEKSEHRGGG